MRDCPGEFKRTVQPNLLSAIQLRASAVVVSALAWLLMAISVMKVAIAHWQGRISPVFDVAGALLLVDDRARGGFLRGKAPG